MSKRKQTYPPAKTNSRGASQAAAAASATRQLDRTVSIDLNALSGGPGPKPKVGDRVRIASGLYAGETAVIESLSHGVIPAASVRTEAGQKRLARTVDLVLIAAEQPEPATPE